MFPEFLFRTFSNSLMFVSVPLPSASKEEPSAGGISKIPSAKNQKVLESISTKYFIGTEDGEVAYCDFKLEKDNETGKLTG